MPWRRSYSTETSGWWTHSFIPFTICKLPNSQYGVYTDECQPGDAPTISFSEIEDAFSWAETEYAERNKRNEQ
jgi:hypothetical protein